ncbi:MAG: YczE/YyaS/YitT family protein, partial [Candidatus Nanopelagicaceae bacterium]
IFPSPHSFPFQVIYVLLGIAMVGAGSALYITCGLGPGPRDGWMTALHKRTGVRVGRVRLGIELSVLSLGWFLGGTFGLGTALFALLIGHSVAISFGVVSRLTAR